MMTPSHQSPLACSPQRDATAASPTAPHQNPNISPHIPKSPTGFAVSHGCCAYLEPLELLSLGGGLGGGSVAVHPSRPVGLDRWAVVVCWPPVDGRAGGVPMAPCAVLGRVGNLEGRWKRYEGWQRLNPHGVSNILQPVITCDIFFSCC